MENTALFIRRCEKNHTQEFIASAFATQCIGTVSDVKFIEKHDPRGNLYYSAIVTFSSWNMNSKVETLLNEINKTDDGSAKFYFNNSRYWIVNIHQQKHHAPEMAKEFSVVDENLPDSERIQQLELLVTSMMGQICSMKNKRKELESRAEESERRELSLRSIVTILKLQNVEKQTSCEIVQEENQQLKLEIQKLRAKLTH